MALPLAARSPPAALLSVVRCLATLFLPQQELNTTTYAPSVPLASLRPLAPPPQAPQRLAPSVVQSRLLTLLVSSLSASSLARPARGTLPTRLCTLNPPLHPRPAHAASPRARGGPCDPTPLPLAPTFPPSVARLDTLRLASDLSIHAPHSTLLSTRCAHPADAALDSPPRQSSTAFLALHRAALNSMGRFQEYQVIGRKLPSDKEPQPKLYRMRIFAPNDVVAKSRFWYFLRKLRKVKKATGEVVAVNVVR